MCKYQIAVYHCGHEVSFTRQTCPFSHIDTEMARIRTSNGSFASGTQSPSPTTTTPSSSPPSSLTTSPSPPLTKQYTHLLARCSPTCPYIRPPPAYLAMGVGRDSDGAWLRDEATGRVLGPAARIDPAVSTAPHPCALKVGMGRGDVSGVGEEGGGRDGHVVFVYGVCAVCDWGFETRVEKARLRGKGDLRGIGEEHARMEMDGFRTGRVGW